MARFNNPLGIATLSLGSCNHHLLEPRLRAAAKAGYKVIDLFDNDWAAYLGEHGLDPNACWSPTPENIAVATKLGKLVKDLGMEIGCTQPLRCIEGTLDPTERKQQLGLVKERFPFMRAFGTNVVFMCANIRRDAGVTADLETVSGDLRELGDMAIEYAKKDGGPPLYVGYEGLSWAQRNTWKASWDVVRTANHPNVGLILDSFNILAVEYANPYNPSGSGRIFDDEAEAIQRVKDSMSRLVKEVPADKILFVQLGDAVCVDPTTFKAPTDPETPKLLPWSRGYRLFPYEKHLGGYMPVDIVAAAILATGYKGALSLEVFNTSLEETGPEVPEIHAQRGIKGLRTLVAEVEKVEPFWK